MTHASLLPSPGQLYLWDFPGQPELTLVLESPEGDAGHFHCLLWKLDGHETHTSLLPLNEPGVLLKWRLTWWNGHRMKLVSDA